jgi:hypothetical protein
MVQERRSELPDMLEAVRQRIETINREKAELVSALTDMLAAARSEIGSETTPKGRRAGAAGTVGRRPGFRMSEEAKARISAAAKKRWAAWRKEQR